MTRHEPSGRTLAPTSSRSTTPVRNSPACSKTISRSGKPSELPRREAVSPLIGDDVMIHSPASVRALCAPACGAAALARKTAMQRMAHFNFMRLILIEQAGGDYKSCAQKNLTWPVDASHGLMLMAS